MAALPLPSKVLATYFTLYDNGGGLRITDVDNRYNMINLFQAVPLNSTNGAFIFQYASAVSVAEIQAVRAKGQRVALTCGGAGAGFNFNTRAKSQAFVNSVQTMNSTYFGNLLDGVDMNNYEAGVGSSATEMTWIAQQLKTLYGPNFSVTTPPHPNLATHTVDRDLTLAMSNAGVLDIAWPQFYDDLSLVSPSYIVSAIDAWVTHLGDAAKVGVGMGANYNEGGNLHGSTTAQSVSAYTSINGAHSTIRGGYGWSTQSDEPANWSFVAALQPLVGNTIAGAPPPAPAVVTLAAPVLSQGSYGIGDLLSASVTFTTTGAATTAAEVDVTARPPGGTHAGGPYLDMFTGTTVSLPLGTRTFTGTRPFVGTDALGTWEVYGTWQDSGGTWHDGPSTFFTVTGVPAAPPPPAPAPPPPPPPPPAPAPSPGPAPPPSLPPPAPAPEILDDTQPFIVLQFSDDGVTWSNEYWLSAGKVGEFGLKVTAHRLGSGRTRLFRIRCYDPIAWHLSGASLVLDTGAH